MYIFYRPDNSVAQTMTGAASVPDLIGLPYIEAEDGTAVPAGSTVVDGKLVVPAPAGSATNG